MFKPLHKKSKKLSAHRKNETNDIVKRKGIITANRVHLTKYPIDNPVAIFNPSIITENDKITIYGRIVLGYFTYASAIAEISVGIEDIYNRLPTHYTAEITVYPDSKFDVWGVEDPRVYEIDGMRLLTYCGRTVNYFDPSVRVERTLPVTAIFDGEKWRKLCVFRMPVELRGFTISDKDAFIVKIKDRLKLFHRPHMKDEKFYLVISNIPKDVLEFKECKEVSIKSPALAFDQAKFEEKIGWGTPPVKIDGEYLLLLHGVDAVTKCYRVFAILMNEEGEVTAVTPYYIMEPKENYEIYGDRPFTVYPCGAVIIDEKLIISYGAADCAIGMGEIDITEIMSILDSNRII
ncbi:MAG: glycosidase [Candidatus Hydrothermarchaeota archaeon]